MPAYLLKICVLCCPDELLTPSLWSYVGRTPESYTRSTLGVLEPFPTKQITVNNNNINLILVVISTEEFFEKLRPDYFRGASAAVFAFSKSKHSFVESVIDHYHEFRRHIPNPTVPIAFIGLHEKSEEVTEANGQSLAQKLGADYFEMVATDLQTLDMVLKFLARKVLITNTSI